MKKLIIIGASGHGKVVAEIAIAIGYQQILFLDDDESIHVCGKFPVVGKTEEFTHYREDDIIVAIGNSEIRQKFQEGLEAKSMSIPVLIHPDAVIASDVVLGKGSVVMAGVVINPGTIIGKGCIINTSSSVDHDCCISDYAHISVGAHLAGKVEIGKKTWIGAGAIVSNNISICGDCVIGAGTVAIKDIKNSGIYVGVPAKKLG